MAQHDQAGYSEPFSRGFNPFSNPLVDWCVLQNEDLLSPTQANPFDNVLECVRSLGAAAPINTQPSTLLRSKKGGVANRPPRLYKLTRHSGGKTALVQTTEPRGFRHHCRPTEPLSGSSIGNSLRSVRFGQRADYDQQLLLSLYY